MTNLTHNSFFPICLFQISTCFEHSCAHFFYILLTVHLGIILVNDQLDAQFFFSYMFIPNIYMFRALMCSFFYILLTVHLGIILVNDQLDAQFFFPYMFIPNLYMFRALMCSSSGELTVSIRQLVYVTLCRWPSGMQVWLEHPNLHTRRSPT